MDLDPQQISQDELERKQILSKYRSLLRVCKPFLKRGDKRQIRLAFDMAIDAHKDMRRKSGEPYIYHPIEVAQIVAEEIGLGTTSVICALLHDTVEDSEITLEDIEREFGKTISRIIDGLTKISGLYFKNSSQQAENFRKMLLTLADDVRVILIKLADRLHNMRTLDSMPRDKQLKISSETMFLFAPLAHRLGLYSIKSELEDLAMKFTEPETYKSIAQKLSDTKVKRTKYIKEFIEPIVNELEKQGLKFEVKGRPKSIYSIWNKMKKQNVDFEEVYDLFAIRIIIDSASEVEKADCWKVYSLVTDFYTPNPSRLRDWISMPRANGYESLHTTVMGQEGKWVEVQIRSKRMNEVAEKGLAAHWRYKEKEGNDNQFDDWLKRIRELLENSEPNALEFVEDVKLQLYNKEIFVFTPKGELRKMPQKATALDFAFEIHSDLGMMCIGAKVNFKLVPLSHQLQNGDQVEILTSKIQKPNSDWLAFVVTAKAKSKIKQSLKEQRKKESVEGKELLARKLKSLKVNLNEASINRMVKFFALPSSLDLYYLIAIGKIDLMQVKSCFEDPEPIEKQGKLDTKNFQVFVKSPSGQNDTELIIDDKIDKIAYTISSCCTPIPGDDIFGFVTVGEGIKIHRSNCPIAVNLLSKYGYRVVKAKWTQSQEVSFLAGIKISGIDEVGIISNLSQVISGDFKVNMRSISVVSNDGMFEGTIMIFVNDTNHLDTLIRNISNVKGVLKASRIESQRN